MAIEQHLYQFSIIKGVVSCSCKWRMRLSKSWLKRPDINQEALDQHTWHKVGEQRKALKAAVCETLASPPRTLIEGPEESI